LVSALLKKTGTGADRIEIEARRKHVKKRLAQRDVLKREALSRAELYIDEMEIASEVGLPAWAPVLIIAPKKVVGNWVDDFKTWSHASVAVFGDASGVEVALPSIQHGSSEVMVMSKSCFKESFFEKLASIQWKLIVVDEFHMFKVSYWSAKHPRVTIWRAQPRFLDPKRRSCEID
jgi:SNF2 family DNA or RNA helicase